MAVVKASKYFSASLLGESVCSTICSINCFLFMLAYSSLVACGPFCHTRTRRPRKHARERYLFQLLCLLRPEPRKSSLPRTRVNTAQLGSSSCSESKVTFKLLTPVPKRARCCG